MNLAASGAPPRAFTLIELLTVIAIIGILAAILIPVLSTVRQKARVSNSMGNMRQMALAVQLHAAEQKNLPPWGVDESVPVGNPGREWMYSLLNYMGNAAGDGGLKSKVFEDEVVRVPIERDPNYAKNLYSGSLTFFGKKGQIERRAINRLGSPSKLVVIVTGAQAFSDGQAYSIWESNSELFDKPEWGGNPAAPISVSAPNNDKDAAVGSIAYRYNGAAGCAFADGHVETVQFGRLTRINVSPFF